MSQGSWFSQRCCKTQRNIDIFYASGKNGKGSDQLHGAEVWNTDMLTMLSQLSGPGATPIAGSWFLIGVKENEPPAWTYGLDGGHTGVVGTTERSGWPTYFRFSVYTGKCGRFSESSKVEWIMRRLA